MAEYIKPEKDRYIKLSQALEVLDSCACWWAHERMEYIPAVDVRPVVRGRWIEYPEVLKLADALNDDYIGCSVCENVWNMMGNDVERFNYCPNCGARMEES